MDTFKVVMLAMVEVGVKEERSPVGVIIWTNHTNDIEQIERDRVEEQAKNVPYRKLWGSSLAQTELHTQEVRAAATCSNKSTAI